MTVTTATEPCDVELRRMAGFERSRQGRMERGRKSKGSLSAEVEAAEVAERSPVVRKKTVLQEEWARCSC